MDPSKQPSSAKLVQSVERALSLLEAVAAGGTSGETAADLAAACGLNRATAWRLLRTLEEREYVQVQGADHRYQLGTATVRLGSSAGILGFYAHVDEILRELSNSTLETASLAIPANQGLKYVSEVTPLRALTVSWLNRTVPLHATSAGKAFLAWLDDTERESVLSQPLERFTNTTVTDPVELERQLAQIREEGFAMCDGELESTLYGVSAPVLDGRRQPFAVVSIWGPMSRLESRNANEFGLLIKRAAESLSADLPKS